MSSGWWQYFITDGFANSAVGFNQPIVGLQYYISGPKPGVDLLCDSMVLTEESSGEPKWRTDARRRIDSLRKSDLMITLKSNTRVRDVVIEVRLRAATSTHNPGHVRQYHEQYEYECRWTSSDTSSGLGQLSMLKAFGWMPTTGPGTSKTLR